jgi:hypothetical protein
VPVKHPRFPYAARAAVALFLVALPAWADAALQLTWRAPEGCPSGAEVQAQVAELLGGRDLPASRRLVAVTTVERTERGTWTVRLETMLEGTSGQRVFEGDSCKTVASTTALILAFALDPDAATRNAQRKENPPAGEPKKASAPEPPPIPPPKPVEPPRLRLQGALDLAVVSGLLPKPTLAARAIVGAQRRAVGAEITALASDERDKIIDRTSVGGSFRLLSLGARIFWEPLDRPWTMRLFGGGELEHVIGKGLGVSHPASGSATMPALALAAQVGWPLSSHLSFHIEGGATARIDRARFVLSPAGSVYEVPVVTFSGATGLELSF